MIKSKEQNTPIIKVSKIKIEIKNSFNLCFILLIQETIHIGVINAVNMINNIDMPSIPNLNFINPLIQFFLFYKLKATKTFVK